MIYWLMLILVYFFNFEGVVNLEDKLRKEFTSFFPSLYSNHKENEKQNLLELYWNILIHWQQEKYPDFLSRLFVFIEQMASSILIKRLCLSNNDKEFIGIYGILQEKQDTSYLSLDDVAFQGNIATKKLHSYLVAKNNHKVRNKSEIHLSIIYFNILLK